MTEPFNNPEGSPENQWSLQLQRRRRSDPDHSAAGDRTPRQERTLPTTRPHGRTPPTAKLGSESDGDGQRTDYSYDDNGNQTTVDAPGAARTPGEAAGRRMTRSYFDGRDLPWVTVTGTGSDARTVVTEYDASRNLRRTVNPQGVAVNSGDWRNSRPKKTDATQYTAPATNTTSLVDATINVYDKDGLKTATFMPYATSEDSQPDAQGKVERPRWKQETVYNTRGWPTDVSNVFRWDPDPGQSTRDVKRYTYSDAGWIDRSTDRMAEGDAQVIDYEYDHAGNQTLWSSRGGTRRIEKQFRPDGQMSDRDAIRLNRAGTPVDEKRSYEYRYNPGGEMTRLIDKDPAPAQRHHPKPRRPHHDHRPRRGRPRD